MTGKKKISALSVAAASASASAAIASGVAPRRTRALAAVRLDARACRVVLRARAADAIAPSREAGRRRHAPSSRRLMELHADGVPGAARDDRVAVFFKERAVRQGASIDPAWRR